MFSNSRWMLSGACALSLGPTQIDALPTVPGVEIANPEWSIIMTPEGYSDVALDKRADFDGREYLSGEWAAAIKYSGRPGPVWLRRQWGFPCWETNSDFTVVDPIGVDTPAMNPDEFLRFISRIQNDEVEITIRYEMVDTTTGIAQGIAPASTDGLGDSTTSSRYVLQQTYTIRNVSGAPLNGICFYHFLHGLQSGTSVYDDRDYGGAMGSYRFDNTQRGTSQSLNQRTGEIFSHEDTVAMHAMVQPLDWECGYFGREGVDDHAEGKPSVGTHLSIEADSLNQVDFFEPEAPAEGWVSGAMSFSVPNLAAGASHELSVLMSIRSVSTFSAPAPRIEILDLFIEGNEFVIDFEETTKGPIKGFILRQSPTMEGSFPADWTQVAVPYQIDVPRPGANRYRIDRAGLPANFFRIEPFLD